MFFSLVAGVVLLVLLAGCHDDQTLAGTEFSLTENPSVPGLYKANFGDMSGVAVTYLQNELADNPETDIHLRNPNNAASGRYTTRGEHTITFSAIENNGGIHGNGKISGPIYLEMRWKTACVEVVHNRATVAGELTYVDLGENPNDIPLEVGWLFYFAVEDNGEGAKAPSDRYNQNLYFGMPGFGAFCDILSPDNAGFWPEDLWYDVTGKGDQIQVK